MSKQELVKTSVVRDPSKPPDGLGAVSIESSKEKKVIEDVASTEQQKALESTLVDKEKLLGDGKATDESFDFMDETTEKQPDWDVDVVENKWYKYQEEEEKDASKNYVYDPCPEIKTSDTELAD